jgi:hypothetical protein
MKRGSAFLASPSPKTSTPGSCSPEASAADALCVLDERGASADRQDGLAMPVLHTIALVDDGQAHCVEGEDRNQAPIRQNRLNGSA